MPWTLGTVLCVSYGEPPTFNTSTGSDTEAQWQTPSSDGFTLCEPLSYLSPAVPSRIGRLLRPLGLAEDMRQVQCCHHYPVFLQEVCSTVIGTTLDLGL